MKSAYGFYHQTVFGKRPTGINHMHAVCEKLKAFSVLHQAMGNCIKTTVPDRLRRTVFKFSIHTVFHSDQTRCQKCKTIILSLYGILFPSDRLYCP